MDHPETGSRYAPRLITCGPDLIRAATSLFSEVRSSHPGATPPPPPSSTTASRRGCLVHSAGFSLLCCSGQRKQHSPLHAVPWGKQDSTQLHSWERRGKPGLGTQLTSGSPPGFSEPSHQRSPWSHLSCLAEALSALSLLWIISALHKA